MPTEPGRLRRRYTRCLRARRPARPEVEGESLTRLYTFKLCFMLPGNAQMQIAGNFEPASKGGGTLNIYFDVSDTVMHAVPETASLGDAGHRLHARYRAWPPGNSPVERPLAAGCSPC